ncbi:MAG: poly-gamma-glutamate system protein [Candidatus Cloacimonetes bacterium]|nr:poly-gamma-glutamate system protein [Candidatus Cloacimonadota bacterium]
MYRPSLKSGRSLIALFALSIILFAIAHNSYKQIRADYYEAKVQASKLMEQYLSTVRNELKKKGFQFDPIDDPLNTGLIGTKLSSITTSRGVLSEKQTALNPNMAAAYIQKFKDAKVKAGDYVAVGITGSNPGANLALYAAMSVLEVKPVIITALSSSMYGANREELSWLDIETMLKDKGLLSFSSSYASLGGKEDLGIGLSDSGIEHLRNAMRRNKVPFLSGNSLADNIDLRFKAYQEMLPENTRYRLFINIGGGLANVGSNVNARLIPEGINRKLAEKEFEQNGIMMLFAKKNVPVLHILRILRLAKEFYLPITPDTMPLPGEGRIFSIRIHNVLVTSICLFILLAAIITVIIFDRYDRHFMANLVDPDDEL